MEKNNDFLTSYKRVRQQLVSKSQDLNDDVDYLTYRRTSRTAKNYSLKEVDDIINTGTLSKKRELSRDYFIKDGLYKRICTHYSTLYMGLGILVPKFGFGKDMKSPNAEKRYYNALAYLDKMNLKELEQKIVMTAIIDGSYFGILQEVTKNNFTVFDLPANYCRSELRDLAGRDVIEFNVLYFDDILDEAVKKETISNFPKVIGQHYQKYQRGKVSTSWVRIPTDISLYFSFFLDDTPPFINVIPSTIQYDEAVETERERDKEEIKKIIVQKIPHLQDGTLLFEPEEALEMHIGAVDMMKGNKNLSVFTTYGDVESIVSKTGSDAGQSNLEKMLQNVYAEASVSPQIFSPTGSQALDTSLRNDTAFVSIIMNKISRFISDLLNYLFGNTSISFKYIILPITYYNQSDYVTDAFKLAQSGYSLLLPSIAMGIEQSELLGLKSLENDSMKLKDILIPLASSYTESGSNSSSEPGRPTIPTEKKKSSTIVKEKSIDKRGGINNE